MEVNGLIVGATVSWRQQSVQLGQTVQWSSSRRCSLRSSVNCNVGWDPEGILGPPSGGHIARREFEKKFKEEGAQKDALQRQLLQERERRRAAREARVVPDNAADLVEYFFVTEATEIEYEIARCRPRLNQEFLEYLQADMATLRFALS